MRAKPHGHWLVTLAIAIPLAACGSSGGSAPGAVSEGEAEALEEAAEMLDERRLPEGTLPPVGLPEGESASEESQEASTQ